MSDHVVSPSELLAFGEAMAMFVAESPGELADVVHFQRRIAGADTNVAIGLARLGFHVGWLSRVGDDGFGTFIRRTLEAEGLDCRHLAIDPEHPSGLLFKERALGGTDPKVAYFRRGSAASHLALADFYLELGAKAVFIKLGPEGSYYRGNLIGAQAVQVVDDTEGLPIRDRLTAFEAELSAH